LITSELTEKLFLFSIKVRRQFDVNNYNEIALRALVFVTWIALSSHSYLASVCRLRFYFELYFAIEGINQNFATKEDYKQINLFGAVNVFANESPVRIIENPGCKCEDRRLARLSYPVPHIPDRSVQINSGHRLES
jgi:hypothetical protein